MKSNRLSIRDYFSITLILFIIAITLVSCNGRGWKVVGTPGISSGDIGHSSFYVFGGIPYVAYCDHAHGEKLTVIKFNGSNWMNVGEAGFTSQKIRYISIFVYNGIPYVAFANEDEERKASVMKFINNRWEYIGSPEFTDGSVVWNLSLYVDNGVPFLAYQDAKYSRKAAVMKYDGQSWQYLKYRDRIPGFSPGAAAYISMSVVNGYPYVIFSDYDQSKKAMVMRWDGIKWSFRGDSNGISEGEAHNTTITHCPQGHTFYVAYSDEGLEGKAVVKTFKGTTWVPLGQNEISEDRAAYPCLCLGQYCEQYVAFRDDAHGQKLSVRKIRVELWEYLGSPGFTSGKAESNIQIQVDNGIPYVVFNDETQGWKPTVMKYVE